MMFFWGAPLGRSIQMFRKNDFLFYGFTIGTFGFGITRLKKKEGKA